MRNFVLFFFLVLTVVPFLSSQALPERAPGGEIKKGKWIGYLKPDDSRDAIALTLDVYLVKPDDIDESPRLTLLFKLGLGGYLSSEYETESFEALEYDWEQGLLVLDNPRNEMVINAFVYSSPRTQMEGKVYLRSAATTATLFLEWQTDEPEEDGPPTSPREKLALAPSLTGQYEGMCGTEKAVLQLETAKGLTLELPFPTTGLHHYKITGVMGVENGLCPRVNPPNLPQWCVDHAFSSGSYDFFQRKLYLSGMLETDECTREGEDLTCRMRLLPKGGEKTDLVEETCKFHKVRHTIANFTASLRRFHVAATAEQRKELPPPVLPLSKDLVAAANGTFFGFLHNEYLDRYQPLRLIVNTTTSTEFQHNPNNVFVSVSAVLNFGSDLSGDFSPQQFDKRSLYLVPGYTLNSEESDTFLQVTEWKKGFISGEWYSRAFGRVGTFEVVKGNGLPVIAPEARFVDSIAGHFRGPGEKDPTLKDYWDLRLVVPKQPRSPLRSYVVFQGNTQLFAGGVSWPIRKILGGAYDFYTGAIAFMTDDNGAPESKLVNGIVDGPSKMRLFWPNERSWAVGVFDYELGTHLRVP